MWWWYVKFVDRESYNYKIYDYGDSMQVRLYKNTITKEDVIRVDVDGCIIERKKGNVKEYNPFTDEYEIMYKFDNERSRKNSMSRTVNTVYEIARANKWQYFFTMTFNPEKIDSTDYTRVVKSMTKWLEHTRERYAPDMKYIVVPELHKDGKKYHFHGLFANIGNLPLKDSGKRDKQGRIIYNIGSYKLGFTTVTEVSTSEKACSYLVKYLSKDLQAVTFGKKRYWSSKNCLRPIVTQGVQRISYEDAHLFNQEEFEKMTEIDKSKALANFEKNIMLERLIDVGNIGRITHIKKVSNLYNDVTYIEVLKESECDVDAESHDTTCG